MSSSVYKFLTKFLPLILFVAAIFAGNDVVLPDRALAENAASADESTALRGLLLQADSRADQIPIEWAVVEAFYAERDYRPAWTESQALTTEGEAARDAILQAAKEGLNSSDYHAAALRNDPPADVDAAARYDLLLSDAFLRYARDVRVGRVSPEEVGFDVDLPDQSFDPVHDTNAALGQGALAAFIADLPPPHPQYAALRTALAHYLALEPNGERRDRIDVIEANMERWRWLPRAFEPRRVEVNVPSASLIVFDSDAPLFASRVVVGRPKDPTPILFATATGVIANPSWHIPMKIVRKEILPKGRGYMESHHMVARMGDDGEMHYRQLPGAKNALGRLKIEMPNRFDVYLHDTPVRSAFAQSDRDLSHGCMRVEQIVPLASFALAGDSQSDVDMLEQAIAKGTTRHFEVAEPLPVYVHYWTAFADDKGEIRFYPDIYGRDAKLIALVNSRIVEKRVAVLSAQ
jgi:murein L,D-transpeptidase YcbB/YkuD